jgi:FkbM family methyltransferase
MKMRSLFQVALNWGKAFLRSLVGYRFRLLNNFLEPGQSFGRAGLDSLVKKIMDLDGGFYIEVGANDGFTQSNSLILENSGDWKGLLIEPIPEIYEELRRNRSARRNFLLNAALVSSEFSGESLELYSAGQMSIPILPSSEIGDPLAHAVEGLRVQSRLDSTVPPTRVTVPAITLDEALRRAKAPRVIDFFSLDVEGWEIEVLSGVDFSRWKFRWMLVETRNLDSLRHFMRHHGYTLHSQVSPRDALFRLSEFAD